MLTRNSADARNCYCLASYTSPPPSPPPESQSHTQGTQGSLCAIMHTCRNIMATTASVRFVLVSCFIYRSEEAKPALGDVDINVCDLAKLPKPLLLIQEAIGWDPSVGTAVRYWRVSDRIPQGTFQQKTSEAPCHWTSTSLHPRSNIQLTLTGFSMKTSPFNTKIPAQHVTLSSPSLRMF